MERRNWTKDELLLAINLYCKLPFGRLNKTNPEIIALSKLIGRTSSSVTWKLVNFASLDPSLQKRGIKGAQNRSKLDEEVWEEFTNNWEQLSYQSEVLVDKYRKLQQETNQLVDPTLEIPEGKEREAQIKQRINQNFFRQMILASYNYRCCITGIDIPELLIASHIIPWSDDAANRLNPRNGLCLNALHDRAFDNGLITISTNYRILISKFLRKKYSLTSVESFFKRYEDSEINLPYRFLPEERFLAYHRKTIFKG